MKINSFLIQLAIIMIIIFGGSFTIRYFIKGELLGYQMIGATVGIILLVTTLIFRKINKYS